MLELCRPLIHKPVIDAEASPLVLNPLILNCLVFGATTLVLYQKHNECLSYTAVVIGLFGTFRRYKTK